MRNLYSLLAFGATLAAAILLSGRWPEVMRKIARSLATVTIVSFLGIVMTGWWHQHEQVATIHRWLPHSLIILLWNAVPFAIGVTVVHERQPMVAVVRVVILITLLGLMHLAAFTGYVGPSHGLTPVDDLTFARFRLLHYWVLPLLSLAFAIAWYTSLAADQKTSPRDVLEASTDT